MTPSSHVIVQKFGEQFNIKPLHELPLNPDPEHNTSHRPEPHVIRVFKQDCVSVHNK